MGQVLDPWFVEMLVCPDSVARLVLHGERLYSTDPKCRRSYAVQNGIPNMLIEESQVVSEPEFARIMQESGRNV